MIVFNYLVGLLNGVLICVGDLVFMRWLGISLIDYCLRLGFDGVYWMVNLNILLNMGVLCWLIVMCEELWGIKEVDMILLIIGWVVCMIFVWFIDWYLLFIIWLVGIDDWLVLF